MFQFDGNTEFDIVLHPVYGPSACIVAKKPITKGEELYVSYNYRIKWAPDWYKEAFKKYEKDKNQGEEEEEEGKGEEEEEGEQQDNETDQEAEGQE
jgi:hypothetical protein